MLSKHIAHATTAHYKSLINELFKTLGSPQSTSTTTQECSQNLDNSKEAPAEDYAKPLEEESPSVDCHSDTLKSVPGRNCDEQHDAIYCAAADKMEEDYNELMDSKKHRAADKTEEYEGDDDQVVCILRDIHYLTLRKRYKTFLRRHTIHSGLYSEQEALSKGMKRRDISTSTYCRQEDLNNLIVVKRTRRRKCLLITETEVDVLNVKQSEAGPVVCEERRRLCFSRYHLFYKYRPSERLLNYGQEVPILREAEGFFGLFASYGEFHHLIDNLGY